MYYPADSGKQRWLYEGAAELWGDDIGADAAADLRIRGYFASVRPVPGLNLTVVALNINYWALQNPQAAAAPDGAQMMEWFAAQLEAAAARGDAVHILGHQPPLELASASDTSPAAPLWRPGYYANFTAIVGRAAAQVSVTSFFGHIHTDQWTLTRGCSPAAPGAKYRETAGGIKWCSGGGDYAPGDVWGAGVDGICPKVPAGWDADRAAAAGEKVCDGSATCVGFTLYMLNTSSTLPREVCFRTGSTASKPPAAGSTTRCYAKPGGECDGPATSLVLPGPSLTEGYPAKNPMVRLLEFDRATHRLLDAHTYVADLQAANRGGSLDWRLEYSFRAAFGVRDMDPLTLEGLATRLASSDGDALWAKLRGPGSEGSLFVGGYSATAAPFPPHTPTAPCTGACRGHFTRGLNGSGIPL